MPQATRVWLEKDRMAHHHQAQVAHGAAHDLQEIRGGQTAQHQVNGDADKDSINATRRAAPTIRTWDRRRPSARIGKIDWLRPPLNA